MMSVGGRVAPQGQKLVELEKPGMSFKGRRSSGVRGTLARSIESEQKKELIIKTFKHFSFVIHYKNCL